MDDSAEIQRLLQLLEHGTPDEQIAARTQLGHIFLAREQWEYAAECFERNIGEGCRDPLTFRSLATAYARQGRAEEAKALLVEAQRLGELGQTPSENRAIEAGRARGPVSYPRIAVLVGLCFILVGVVAIFFDLIRAVIVPWLPSVAVVLLSLVLVLGAVWRLWNRGLRGWVRGGRLPS